jgi:cell division protein FtsI/penicillin-binding protein 2
MRNSFAQFGLGVRTGIDLPNEMSGFKGSEVSPGKLLDLAIGQYDTYTPMQLAQYVSSIANGGNRMKPHMVKEIRDPVDNNEQLGPVAEDVSPTVLNRLDMKEEWIERVQSGFDKVAMEQGGTAYKYFGNKPYTVAAKTGTAEAFYDGPNRLDYSEPQETMNITLVGYAPAKNPEVAFAVVVPWAYQGHTGHSMSKEIGEEIMDTYFELKKERAKKDKENTETSTDLKVENGKDVQKDQAEVRKSQENE